MIFHPGAYCRDLWNILDATVVICALVAFFFTSVHRHDVSAFILAHFYAASGGDRKLVVVVVVVAAVVVAGPATGGDWMQPASNLT